MPPSGKDRVPIMCIETILGTGSIACAASLTSQAICQQHRELWIGRVSILMVKIDRKSQHLKHLVCKIMNRVGIGYATVLHI